MASAELEVRETGRALKVQTEAPNLVSMGGERLSTAVTLHPLPEGRVILGSDRNADILISGTGVELVHCAIENFNGIVTLHPINGNTSINGIIKNSPTKLAQDCIISISDKILRFNHPADAKYSKSVFPNPYISMASISPSLSGSLDLERKPPTVPKKSPRNSCSSDDVGFLSKLTKFEMLASQSRNCVSPKVFPAGSLTTNVPADQILGHSRSSSSISLSKCHNSPLQNLTNINKSHSNTPNRVDNLSGNSNQTDDHRNRIERRISHNTSIPNQSQIYNNAKYAFNKNCKLQYNGNNDENNGSQNSINSKLQENNFDLMSKSFQCQRSSADLNFDKFENEFDMSQSLIISKTTTEYFQVDKFSSNPNLYSRPSVHGSNHSCNGSIGSYSLSSNATIKRIQPPSPAFNRNPKYNSDQKFLYGRMRSPTPKNGGSCSLEKLKERELEAENKKKEAQNMKKQAQEERFREQEIEKQEKVRLEEVLAMCAEYDKQSGQGKPRQPNRIKTNGSLPKDKRPCYNSAFNSPKSPTQQSQFSFDSPNTTNESIYQNENFSGRFKNESINSSRTPNNNQSPKYLNGSTNSGFSASTSQIQNGTYENVRLSIEETDNMIVNNRITTCSNSPSSHKNLSTNGNMSVYENVVQNNNQNYLTVMHNDNIKKSFEMIDDKNAISNDDLLEAIEQLSMLSKPKDTYLTPKKNNCEKVNTELNEMKTEKEPRILEADDKRKYIEFLKNEKLHILGNMNVLKRSVSDIEIQEEEINRALELEKALLSAEYESESLKLLSAESEKITIENHIKELECRIAKDTESQTNLQAEAKCRVEKAEQMCLKIEEDYKNCRNESLHQELAEKLNIQQEALENEKKTFEDMEFHHLEEEASKLATREEYQRYLSELSNKIESRKSQLNHLESQKNEAKSTATKESRSLERLKLGHMRRLEEGRNRIREIDEELNAIAKNSTNNSGEKRSPSREDFDRISRVTYNSPIVNNNHGSLGPKTIESFKEIERNRQLHLSKQGSQVISEERRRVEELKRRVQDEVRTQWEERKMNCASFNSVESGEESSSYSIGPTESGSGSSDGADIGANEKKPPIKLSEFTSTSPGPSTNSYVVLHQNENMSNGRRASMEDERLSMNSAGINVNTGSRPLSQTSSEVDSVGSFQTVKHRDKLKSQRPLTRYLPIKSESLDLRHHIETAGHHLPLIHDITVDSTTCSGTLSKMSKKFHHWNKRWFIFDRKKKSLSYYSESSSKKPRGIIYFQSIEAVYVDPINPVRSPQPSLTFVVKTVTRSYHLMAPSPEAMRVWVDVVITGAEGQEFDYGV